MGGGGVSSTSKTDDLLDKALLILRGGGAEESSPGSPSSAPSDSSASVNCVPRRVDLNWGLFDELDLGLDHHNLLSRKRRVDLNWSLFDDHDLGLDDSNPISRKRSMSIGGCIDGGSRWSRFDLNSAPGYSSGSTSPVPDNPTFIISHEEPLGAVQQTEERPLTNPQAIADEDAPSKERMLLLKQLLELLVHASRCGRRTWGRCRRPTCRKIKGLFRHGAMCKVRSFGGCVMCRKMWYFILLHARNCEEEYECLVPRCKDLKKYLTEHPLVFDSLPTY